MVMDILWLGVALLLAPALAEIAKVEEKRGFTWIAAGGVCYLLATAFMLDIPNLALGSMLQWGTVLFSVIGLVTVVVGAIIFMMDTFR